MGQTCSEEKQNSSSIKRSRNSFIILVDTNDVLESSILDEPSILTDSELHHRQLQQLPIKEEQIMSTHSYSGLSNIFENEILNDLPERLTNDSSLTKNRVFPNNKYSYYDTGDGSKVEASSLGTSQQQRKREDKVKKVCTCKFIIASDISNHEQTLAEKLRPTYSHASRISEKVSDEDLYKSISQHESIYSDATSKSRNKQEDIYEEILPNRVNKQTGKNEISHNTQITQEDAVPTAFRKYANAKASTLSSLVRKSAEEKQKLKSKLGNSLPEKEIPKEESDSQSLKELLKNSHGCVSCPFCGATSSSLLSSNRLLKSPSLRRSKTFCKKFDKADELEGSVDCESFKLQENLPSYYPKSVVFKKSKASSVNIVKHTKDEQTSTIPTRCCHQTTSLISEDLSVKNYPPEKFYISLKRNQTEPSILKEQSNDEPETSQTGTNPEQPQENTVTAQTTLKVASVDKAVDTCNEEDEDRSTQLQTAKNSYRLQKDSQSVLPAKTRSIIDGENRTPHTTANKSARPKINRLTLQNVNKSSFKPPIVPKSCKSKSYNCPASTNLDEVQSEKPAKIVLEIPGSILPKNLIEQMTRSQIKTYVSSERNCSNEKLKSLVANDLSKLPSKEELADALIQPVRKSSIPRKIPSSSFDSKNNELGNPSELRKKSTEDELIQTKVSYLRKPKHLNMTQVFMSSIRPNVLRNMSGTFFEEIHKYPKPMRRSSQTSYKSSGCNFNNAVTPKSSIEENSSFNQTPSTTSRESVQSQASYVSEFSLKSFPSDVSDSSHLPVKGTRGVNNGGSESCESFRSTKRKTMLKSTEHLSKISEVSPNDSVKSVTSSASEGSLTIKREKRGFEEDSHSEHSTKQIRKSFPKQKLEESTRDKLIIPRKLTSSNPPLSPQKDRNLPSPLPRTEVSKQPLLQLGKPKQSDATKLTGPNGRVNTRNRPPFVKAEASSSTEDFRESSAHDWEQNQQGEVIKKAASMTSTYTTDKKHQLPLLSHQQQKTDLRLTAQRLTAQKVWQALTDKGPNVRQGDLELPLPEKTSILASPVTFCSGCRKEMYSDEESHIPRQDQANLSDTSNQSSELSYIIEESSDCPDADEATKETEVEYYGYGEPSPQSNRQLDVIRPSEKFMRVNPFHIYYFYEYGKDPSTKYVRLMEKRYNKKFFTINELLEKPPKDIIIFIRKGVLTNSAVTTIQPATGVIDYRIFLKSLKSGV